MSIFVRINLASLALVLCISCGNKHTKDPDQVHFDNASDYNDYISESFDEVLRLWNATLVVMDDSIVGYQMLDSLTIELQNDILKMKKLSDFDGDTLYREAALAFFKSMEDLANNEFKESIDIMIQEEVSDSLFFRMDELGKLMGEKKSKAINQLLEAQMSFKSLVEKE